MEGIFMRYSNEFKQKAVELYYRGEWPDTPEGINQRNFRGMIRRWVRIDESCGTEGYKHKNLNKNWTPEEKYALVAEILAGATIQGVSSREGLNSGLLYSWLQKYKAFGYNGLVRKRKCRLSKDQIMNDNNEPKELSESEREELIRLRAENEAIKAEIEVVKKRIALRQERWAAQLKAKKQQSSKNSENKDTH